MKTRNDFLKMINNLPAKARVELVYGFAVGNPMTLRLIAEEVEHNTKLSKRILEDLGYD